MHLPPVNVEATGATVNEIGSSKKKKGDVQKTSSVVGPSAPSSGGTVTESLPMSCVLKRASSLFKFDEWPEREDVYIQIRLAGTDTVYNFKRETTGFPGEGGVDNYGNAAEFYVCGHAINRDDESTWCPEFKAMYYAQTGMGGQGIDMQFVSERGPGGWNSCKYSPIALDVINKGSVDRIYGDFAIDIDGSGDLEELNEWFGPDEAILVHNVTYDTIVTGTHFFGDMGGKYSDGYQKLANLFDKNKDNKISGPELEGFKLWIDANSNALLDAGELHELKDYEVTEIGTVHDGNHVSWAKMKGQIIMTEDLWFSR